MGKLPELTFFSCFLKKKPYSGVWIYNPERGDSMKKVIVTLICLVVLAGCYSYDCTKLRNTNRQNLHTLKKGMAKEEVLQLMGDQVCEDTFVNAVGQKWIYVSATNPYRTGFWDGNDKTLEVVYYYTDVKKADGAITDDELTPLVFENDTLIGWGLEFLQRDIKKYELRIR